MAASAGKGSALESQVAASDKICPVWSRSHDAKMQRVNKPLALGAKDSAGKATSGAG